MHSFRCSGKQFYTASRQAYDLQQRMLKLEEGREEARRRSSQQASLLPELHIHGVSYLLSLVNSGEAEARNVRVTLGEKPLNEHLHTTKVMLYLRKLGLTPRLAVSWVSLDYHPISAYSGTMIPARDASTRENLTFRYEGGLLMADEKRRRLPLGEYRVLLTRGMKGCYAYFVDLDTRSHIQTLVQ